MSRRAGVDGSRWVTSSTSVFRVLWAETEAEEAGYMFRSHMGPLRSFLKQCGGPGLTLLPLPPADEGGEPVVRADLHGGC